MKTQLRPIVTFIVLALLFSSAPYVLIIHAHHLGIGGGLVTGVLMWMPALAAFATCRLLKIDPATLGWSWRPARYEGLAYLLPVFYATPVYVACWIFVPHSLGFGVLADAAAESYAMPRSPGVAALLSIIVFATFGLVRSLASALGEEIGWRGLPVAASHRPVRVLGGLSDQRLYLGPVALPGAAASRLQLRHAEALRADLLHDDGDRNGIPSWLVTSTIAEPVAVCRASCQPQSLHPGHLRRPHEAGQEGSLRHH